MNVPVNIEVEGLQVRKELNMDLDLASLDQSAGWCGSYDILEMGQHFDAYVITPRTLLLPPIVGFPATRRFTRLPGKWPAPSVQGNIGEAITALTAVANMGFEISGVAHIKPGKGRSRSKTPDLLLRVTQEFKRLVCRMCELDNILFPVWIPCEAKCRKTAAGISRAIKEARSQLEAFWNMLPQDESGFGIACCFVHCPPQSIQVRIFLPEVITEQAFDKVFGIGLKIFDEDDE